jgi:hypothetical protein
MNKYNINTEILDTLLSFCDMQNWGPGALLYNPNENSLETQLNLINSIISEVKPSVVLETGTESGLFSYFIKCISPETKVLTFGLDESLDHRGTKCINFLNSTFGDYITYIIGDSCETLSKYNSETLIQFAWIDGGHYGDTPYKDLVNCERLSIVDICVDDYNLIPDVKKCVDRFVTDYPNYKIITTTSDERGIIHLRKIDQL